MCLWEKLGKTQGKKPKIHHISFPMDFQIQQALPRISYLFQLWPCLLKVLYSYAVNSNVPI